MLAKRIIPCLDVKDGRVVKGVNFVGLRDAGDPVELAKFYSQEGADEIVFLDITATSDNRDTIADVVRRTCREVFVPVTVGGGIRTVDDVEKIVVMCREREQQLRKLLARLGQRRTPSEDEKALYKTWIDEWGFTPEAVQEACRETTKGTPTMAYLNGILMRQHQLGRHEVIALETGMQTEHEARNFAREVYAGLGVTGKTPTQDDLAAIETWHEQGANDELILLAVKAAHGKSGGGNMDDVDNYLQDWRRRGLTTPEAVRAESARTRMLNGQLREIYAAAGVEKRPNAPDRDLLCHWAGEMGMTQELIVQAAEYARGAGSPMMLIGRILRDWSRAGISTLEAARQEHESHIQGIAQKAPVLQTAQKQDAMLRYTPEERRATYSAAVVNFDEEDDGQ